MLGSMRTLSKSFASKLLMLMLIVSFAAWGVGDILTSSGNPSYAAKVGSETVPIGEFQQQRQLMQRQLESMGIQGMPPGRLEMTIIRQLITQKLSMLAMRDMGLFVNDETAPSPPCPTSMMRTANSARCTSPTCSASKA
jgi:peptidyl-prolyl cis-trans isomerase D